MVDAAGQAASIGIAATAGAYGCASIFYIALMGVLLLLMLTMVVCVIASIL